MQRNLLHYQRALYLRKKKGYSYREIMDEIPVAKSTLSGWLSGIELTSKQQRRIKQKQYEQIQGYNLGEWNRLKRQRERTQIRAKAKQEVTPLTKDQFFITGIMLYWAEGDKTGKDVRVSNSDPIFIRLMMKWFREYANVPEEKFRAALHYHDGQDELAIRKYWSRLTKIPLAQFHKSFCKPPGTGHRTHILHYGTLQVRIGNADLFHRIVGWREGLLENLLSGKTVE